MTDNPTADVAVASLEQVAPEDFAKLIAESSDEQIAEVVNGPQRKHVLDQIFSRMADHMQAERIGDAGAVVHFKIFDRPEDQGGDYDHFEVVFENGRCAANDQPERDPNVTIKVGPVDFLKLAANQGSGPTLF